MVAFPVMKQMEAHLSEKQLEFLRRRRKLVRWWPLGGGLLLLVIGGLAGGLFWRAPVFVNPFLVESQLQAGQMPDATEAMLAVLLPVMVLLCLFFAAILVLLTFSAIANERRHLQIITTLSNALPKPQPEPKPGEPTASEPAGPRP